MDDELSETRSLLREITDLFRQEKAAHAEDVERIWSFCQQMLQHHDSMSSDVHRLLEASEDRIKSTNDMVHGLSCTCHKLVETNESLKDSYVSQFDASRREIEYLLAENARLMKENEAYYLALKEERDRNSQIMTSMISTMCAGRSQPYVNIDQKQK